MGPDRSRDQRGEIRPHMPAGTYRNSTGNCKEQDALNRQSPARAWQLYPAMRTFRGARRHRVFTRRAIHLVTAMVWVTSSVPLQ